MVRNVMEEMRESERKCDEEREKNENGEMCQNEVVGWFNEVGVGLMRVISEVMSCQ